MDYRGLAYGIVRVLVSLVIGLGILGVMRLIFRRADRRT